MDEISVSSLGALIRRFKVAFTAIGLSLSMVVLVAFALYVLSQPEVRFRIDFSQNTNNTCSERTINSYKALSGASIVAFLYEEDKELVSFNSTLYSRAHSRIRVLLEDLRVRVGGSIEVTVLDISAPPLELSRYADSYSRQPGDVLVIAVEDSQVNLRFDDIFEYTTSVFEEKLPARLYSEKVDRALGDAALRLIKAKPLNVTIVAPGVDVRDLDPLRELLEQQGYNVQRSSSFSTSSTSDLILVPGQRFEFSPRELEAVERWISDGRHLMVALGAFTPSSVIKQWNALLEGRGGGFVEGLVCQPVVIAGAPMEGRQECAILEITDEELNGQHPVNSSIIRSKRPLVFAAARPLSFGRSSNKFSELRLVRSSAMAWLEKTNSGQIFVQESGEPVGIQTLSVSSELWSGGAEKLRSGRLVLVGSEDVFKAHLPYNSDWARYVLAWLSGEDLSRHGLQSVEVLPFSVTIKELSRIKLLTVFVIPGLFFVLSFLVWWRRR